MSEQNPQDAWDKTEDRVSQYEYDRKFGNAKKRDAARKGAGRLFNSLSSDKQGLEARIATLDKDDSSLPNLRQQIDLILGFMSRLFLVYNPD